MGSQADFNRKSGALEIAEFESTTSFYCKKIDLIFSSPICTAFPGSTVYDIFTDIICEPEHHFGVPHKAKNLLLLTLTLAVAPVSFASTVTWTLSDVTFSDGATATGSFQFDADSNTFGSWNINVTTGVLSAFTYTNGNSSPFDGVQASGYQPTFFFSQNGSTRELRITPLTALTDAGGTVAINLNAWGSGSGSVECVNCTPYRNIVSGSLTTDSLGGVPEPGSMGFVGIGLVSASIFGRRWKSRMTQKLQSRRKRSQLRS